MWWHMPPAIAFRGQRQRQAELRLVYRGRFQASWGSVLRPSLKKKMKALRRGREWRVACGDRRKGGKRNKRIKKLRNVD